MNQLLLSYLPIVIFIGVALAIGLALLVVPFIIAYKQPDSEKLSAYECGFAAFDDARMKFDVRFYLVAILFIIFDLEVAFLFPWVVAFKTVGWLGPYLGHDLPGRADRRLHLRVEEGRARMGLIVPASPVGTDASALRQTDRDPFFTEVNEELADKGFLGHLHRRPDQLGAHRLADVDDVRARLLRGRDDADVDAAL